MNSEMKRIAEELNKVFEKDPRIIGAWETGSVGKNEDDAYSDVDPAFLIKDECFEEFDKELKGIIAKVFPKIHLWWAEVFNDDSCKNYGILIETDDLYQYDINIIKKSAIKSGSGYFCFCSCNENSIIFDKEGFLKGNLLPVALELEDKAIEPSYLIAEIDKYWLYAYISVKYFKRGDVFKAIYARDMLREVHLNILRMLIKKGDWSWWARSINKNLEKTKTEEMLVYFDSADIEAMKVNFHKQINIFDKDARNLCSINKIDYPIDSAESVINYINKSIGIQKKIIDL